MTVDIRYRFPQYLSITENSLAVKGSIYYTDMQDYGLSVSRSCVSLGFPLYVKYASIFLSDGEVSPGDVKDEGIAKKQRPSQESLGDPELPGTMQSHLSEHSSTENSYSDTSAYKPVRIPSLGIYSDSSDSESSSSDSDILPTLFSLSSNSNSK